MKIYDRDYNCFGCGANGDIFSFIEQFYGIGFKDAFLMLGGTYEKKSSKWNVGSMSLRIRRRLQRL
jgi:DNA primase